MTGVICVRIYKSCVEEQGSNRYEGDRPSETGSMCKSTNARFTVRDKRCYLYSSWDQR